MHLSVIVGKKMPERTRAKGFDATYVSPTNVTAEYEALAEANPELKRAIEKQLVLGRLIPIPIPIPCNQRPIQSIIVVW